MIDHFRRCAVYVNAYNEYLILIVLQIDFYAKSTMNTLGILNSIAIYQQSRKCKIKIHTDSRIFSRRGYEIT